MMKPRKLKQQISRRCFYPFFIFCMIGLYSGSTQVQNNQENVLILEAAEFTIHGKTNINSFSCNLIQAHLNDTLATIVNPTTDKAGIFEGLEILFKVVDFKCDLTLMTKEFQKLLKEEEYPFIRMQIEKVDLNSTKTKGNKWKEDVTANILLYIAGVQRYEQITDAKINRNNDKFIFSGTYQLHLTNFKITPPTKILGAVRTKDILEVNFSLVLKFQ